jgi:tetratricopeptide (TPR) repeat protein
MKSEWWVYLIGVMVVAGGLAIGAYSFRQKSQEKRVDQQIAFVESLQNEKRYEEALAQIEALSPRLKDPEVRARLDRLAIQILMRAKKTDDARKRAEAYLQARPNDPQLGIVHYVLGKIALEQEGNRRKAGQHFEEVVTQYANDPSSPGALLGLANLDVLAGELMSAKKRLDELIGMPLDSDLKASVENLLGQVNTQILFSQNLLPGDEFYEVKSGDTPIGIGKRFHVEPELLLRCNRIRDAQKLRADRRLKIPKVDFSIIVNISDNTLTLLNNGTFFKKYRVRTGRSSGLTPTGQFRIEDKLKNPSWEDPATGRVHKPGSPENELGTRWLKFDRPGLGIHGTIHPESIGQYASQGCIGMLKDDVEELYDLVPRRTPVMIIGERPKADYGATETTSETKRT